jgi:hypothetical protein
VTLARLHFSQTPPITGGALWIAVGSIVGLPVLAALFPRRAAWLALPLLVITGVGICLTVPDIERVTLVTAGLVLATIVCLAIANAPNRFVFAAIALVMVEAAILDSGGRGAAIVRAVGCFGVFLIAPVSGWLNELRSGTVKIHPPNALLVIVHCVLVGWSSRGLIRETSLSRVLPAIAAALLVATALLVAASRPVAVET